MADIPNLPGIPTVTPVTDQTIAAILRPMKESLEILGSMVTGAPLPNGQVISTGIQNLTSVSNSPNTSAYNPLTDYTPPPMPTGFSIMGAFTNIIMSWDDAAYLNHAYTEVWRSTTNVLSTAALIGFAPGSVYTDTVGNNSTYYYWIRFVSQANITGPYNSPVGTLGQTALDPAYVMSVLRGQITESQLYADLSSKINLITADPSVPGSVNARLTTETTSRTTADSALQSSITTLQSTVSTNQSTLNASIQSEATTRANADSALSTSITTLQSTVNTNNTTLTAAVSTEATTRASVDGGLLAQYTVKVDINGRVAGFGLASTTTGGTPTSSFIVIADRFAVVSPSSTGETPSVPFAIGVVDGVTRVAMVNAFIQDAAITNAKIANLAVDSAKIANLAVGTAKMADASITAAKIIDANITTAKIADAAITNAKIANLAVGTANIADASITAAKIVNASITNAQIANGTITSAQIADATITSADIASATITAANIASATITNAQIASATIVAANIADGNITNAKIASAAIDNAKIANAAVSTLSIQGQAVTIPVSAFVAGERGAGDNNYGWGISLTVSFYSTGAPKVITFCGQNNGASNSMQAALNTNGSPPWIGAGHGVFYGNFLIATQAAPGTGLYLSYLDTSTYAGLVTYNIWTQGGDWNYFTPWGGLANSLISVLEVKR